VGVARSRARVCDGSLGALACLASAWEPQSMKGGQAMSPRHREAAGVLASWVVGHLLGWAMLCALVAGLPVVKSVSSVNVVPLIIGVPFGLAQWLVLRRFTGLSPLWVLALPIGWLLCSAMLAAIPQSSWQIVDDESPVTLTVIYMVMGAVVALPQWVLLRRRFARAGTWLLGSSAGLGLGFGLVLATGLIQQSELGAYTVVVLVYGLATGSILSWLLPHEARRPIDPTGSSGSLRKAAG